MFGQRTVRKNTSQEERVSSRIFLPSEDVPRRVRGLGLERLPLQTNTPTTELPLRFDIENERFHTDVARTWKRKCEGWF